MMGKTIPHFTSFIYCDSANILLFAHVSVCKLCFYRSKPISCGMVH